MRHWDGRERRRLTVEEPAVDIRRLRRRGELQIGRAFWYEPPGFERVGIRVGRDLVMVGETRVRLAWRKLRFGWRPFFVCPCCGQRCCSLHPRIAGWACRKCCGLAYRSQLELVRRRGEMAAHKIQKRLGGWNDSLDLPPRPKGMRRAVYENWMGKHSIALRRLTLKQLKRYW